MTKGIMVITGNSIAELKADLKALENAIGTGKTVGCGGTSIDEVKDALVALASNIGCEVPTAVVEKCVCTCSCDCDTDCEDADDCSYVDDAYEEGKEEGYYCGYDEGYDDGCNEGYDNGKREGYDEGYDNAMREIKEKLGLC